MGPVSNLPDVGPASISGGWTVPEAPPSMVTIWPSARWAVASPVATTAGVPYSPADTGGRGAQGAAVGDHLNRVGNQRRPGRSGGPSDQHLTGLEVIEVIGPMDDA